MRARGLKPGFFENEILGSLDAITCLLFAGLPMLADKEGRLEDRPKRIKALLFPYRESLDINRELTVLERSGFIHRYEVDGNLYILIINFKKHQSPHHTEKESVIPPPGDSPLKHREYPPDSLTPDLLNPDSLTGETNQTSTPTPIPTPIPVTESKASVTPPTPKAVKISLAELSVDHIREWLADKRIEGRYVNHDEHFILEQFKNYCQSKGKQYADYTAGYRNAFEWERCQPKQSAGHSGQGKSKLQRTIEAAERATVARERQYQEGG